MNRWRVAFFVTVCFSLLVVSSLFAQEGTGGITGRVTDPQGAVVTNAKVIATNHATLVQTTAASNSAGVYELPNLIPGTYSVEASAPNFKKILRTSVLVQVEDHIGLDFKLEVGSFNEELTVTTQAPQLRTEDAQTGEVITEHMIETLVQLDRDPLKLLTLSGNVQGTGDRAGWNLSVTNGGFYSGPADTRINGGRPGGVEYLIDGVPATGGYVHNVTNATPTMDDVQEFKVITNGISSEYGRLSGGVVEVSTKSGENALHGQLFEYHKDSFLNANNWANDLDCGYYGPMNSACQKANFRQNRFGFAVGGPVVLPHLYDGRKKTFFFTNAEWLRNSTSGNNVIGSTITDKERNSFTNPVPCPDGTAGGCIDLTDIGFSQTDPNYPWAALGDPFVTSNMGGPSQSICNTYYGPTSPFNLPALSDPQGCLYPSGGDGRHIPISETGSLPGGFTIPGGLNGQVAHYVASMPHATPGLTPQFGNTAGNYQYRQPQKITDLAWNLRVDHAINDKQRIYGRFAHDSATNFTQPAYSNYATNGNAAKGAFSTSLHYDYTITPTLVLDFTTGGNYSPVAFGNFLTSGPNVSTATWGFDPQVTSVMGTALLGFGQIWTEGHDNGAPVLGDNYLHGPGVQKIATTNFYYSAALTKIMGRHAMKFGYEGRRFYDNVENTPGTNGDGFFVTPEGTMQGESLNTNSQPPWGNRQADANGVGAFFYGLDTWSQQTAATSRDLASNYYAAYLQDDFKVNSKLTLNLGVRWEMQTPVTERNNNISVWDPNAAPPFTVSPVAFQQYAANWNQYLLNSGLSQAQANQVQQPAWVTAEAFSPGAQEFVGTPEHPGRGATKSHPWNFAPRFGFAYQALEKTVVRGSFGIFYLPTGGNLSDYGDAPGVAYSNSWTSTNSHPQNVYYPFLQTITKPYNFPDIELTPYSHDNPRANLATALNGNGTGGIDINSHMPHEYDWSLGIERQLPANFLLELTYSGNASNSLFALVNPGRFPAGLYNGGPAVAPSSPGGPANNAWLYLPQFNSAGNCTNCVQSPTAGMISPGAVNFKTGDAQPLGMLEFPYPYFGPVNEEDVNSGSAHYESLNVRVQKRMSHGLQFLVNYTFSKALDNVGAANLSTTPNSTSYGTNGKAYQSVLTPGSVYGLAAADQTHRLSTFLNYQLPFGRGRQWMSNPHGLLGNVLEYAAGGWETSGTFLLHSGNPATISINNGNLDSAIDIWQTFGSLAPGQTIQDAVDPGHNNPRSTLCLIACSANPPASQPRALNFAALANSGNATSFTIGNLPPNLGNILRQPTNWNSDVAIMKSFPLGAERSRYFELRLEGQNLFNHPGLGNYDNNATDATYGMIANCDNGHNPCTANTERQVQISGRIVF
jgi:hypothetical protein